MLQLGHFPQLWTNAIVIMVPKLGLDGRFTQNHRPISLLSSISKIGEKVIRTRFMEEIEDKNIIPEEQFGFRAEHSTEGQALRLAENIYDNIELKKFTPVIFLEVAKAFDKVWHEGLIYKLHRYGINQNLITLITSFLRNRTYQVRYGSKLSRKRNIEAGVPQGAVLSPTLYNLYTADIPTNLPNTRIYTYADDTAIATSSRQIDSSVEHLQNAINMVCEWMARWKIKINAAKSQPVIFTHRRATTNIEIEIDEQILDRMEKKFNILSPFLGRKSKMNIKNKLLLYKQVIRPIAT